MTDITLILGGVRSGKSACAERLALSKTMTMGAGYRIYLATAEARDDEMKARIHHHQLLRDKDWLTVEEPLQICSVLEEKSTRDTIVLVECLTMWLSNLMEAGHDPTSEGERLCSSLARLPGSVILVSNEVGLGIMPDNKLARDFADATGRLNQRVAAMADQVLFIAAGLPLVLKG